MSEQPGKSGIDRRALLGAVGAVAAGGMALDAAFGEGPAAKVEDRNSSIRITNLKATPVGPKAYVKDRDEPQNHRLGRSHRPRAERRPRAGRLAVRVARRTRTRRASSTCGRSSTARTATCAAGRSWSTRSRPSTWRCGTSPASCTACRSIACSAARAATASACIRRPRPRRSAPAARIPFPAACTTSRRW